jgi:hypothetical protein
MLKKVTLLALPVVAAAALCGNATVANASPVSRANAVRTAHDYLQSEAFSFKGLVGQLKFEGYSTFDSNYAARHSGANWMKQAVKKAREYLQSQGFSRSGLIEQLKFEGFTPAQALHGVRAVGL